MTVPEQVRQQLAAWDAGAGPALELHVGDLGWADRQPPGIESVEAWWDGDDLVAVAQLDGDSARPRVRADRIDDAALADEVADRIDALTGAKVVSDAMAGSALREALLARGWAEDPTYWLTFHSPADPALDDGILSQPAEVDVEGRVAVQRAGFANSTFDLPRWQRMAAGPAYRAELDLVVLDPVDGMPGAALTAWLSIPGGTALIEPLATHPDHRGRGLGRHAVLAATAACGRAGASGVSVATPESNTGGVATYLSAGYEIVMRLNGLFRS